MSSDVNLLSFNGPQDNGRTVDMRGEVLDGAGLADAVKCSTGLTDFTAMFGTVISGSEDALDVNNECRNLRLSAELWVLTGKIGFTIKGGSEDVEVSGRIRGKGLIELGGWSDQSHKKTRRVRLDVVREDNNDETPIPVRCLLSEPPNIESGGPYVYVFPSPKLGLLHPVIVWCFMTLRRWGFFR